MLICESVERALLTKCQIVSVLSFSLTTWWRLCLARKRAAQMENFTALLSVSIFLLSDYEPLYISADVYFH